MCDGPEEGAVILLSAAPGTLGVRCGCAGCIPFPHMILALLHTACFLVLICRGLWQVPHSGLALAPLL